MEEVGSLTGDTMLGAASLNCLQLDIQKLACHCKNNAVCIEAFISASLQKINLEHRAPMYGGRRIGGKIPKYLFLQARMIEWQRLKAGWGGDLTRNGCKKTLNSQFIKTAIWMPGSLHLLSCTWWKNNADIGKKHLLHCVEYGWPIWT